MKSSNLFLFLLILTLSTNCNRNSCKPKTGIIDLKFVGIWKGEEISKNNTLLRSWTQTRKKNGTYSIEMVEYKNGKVLNKQTENGYRYIMVDENKKNDICPIHSTLLNEDGGCNKCLNENNK